MKIFNENDTIFAVEVMDADFQIIDTFNIANDTSLLLQMKVSGDIFAFPEIELAIYSENNLPFNSLGQLMITRIFKDQFLMSDNPILKVVWEIGSESHFSDSSFYDGGSITDEVFLNFQATLEYWNKHRSELKEDKILFRLSGTNGQGNEEVYMKDIPLLTLTR